MIQGQQVTIDNLFELIGRQTVQIELHKKEIELLRARIAQLEAKLREAGADNGEAKAPPWGSMIDPEAARVAG